MINNITLVGRMTRDPEFRRTINGNAVTNFSLALNRNFNSADGQQTDYIDCVVWNKAAESVNKYCSKGSLVGVEGRLQSRTYENADGKKIKVVEVVCRSVRFLDTRNGAKQQNTQENHSHNDSFDDMQTVNLEQNFDNSFADDFMEDDIQF